MMGVLGARSCVRPRPAAGPGECGGSFVRARGRARAAALSPPSPPAAVARSSPLAAMEHFIETVRKYPCLWNARAIEYRDQELKDAAWAEVMKETDLSSVKEVKLKWKKLRDSYRDALKRQSEMLAKDPGSSSKKSYPWKYMGLMQFLQPYMSNRKKPEAYAPAALNGTNGQDHSSEESESEAESSLKRKSSGDQLSVIDRKLDYLCKAQQSKRQCTEATQQERQQSALPETDTLDIFFNSMCQSTKRFPFPTQIKIKKILFNAVIEAEEALVSEQQRYASLWTREQGSSSSSDNDAAEEDAKPS